MNDWDAADGAVFPRQRRATMDQSDGGESTWRPVGVEALKLGHRHKGVEVAKPVLIGRCLRESVQPSNDRHMRP